MELSDELSAGTETNTRERPPALLMGRDREALQTHPSSRRTVLLKLFGTMEMAHHRCHIQGRTWSRWVLPVSREQVMCEEEEESIRSTKS